MHPEHIGCVEYTEGQSRHLSAVHQAGILVARTSRPELADIRTDRIYLWPNSLAQRRPSALELKTQHQPLFRPIHATAGFQHPQRPPRINFSRGPFELFKSRWVLGMGSSVNLNDVGTRLAPEDVKFEREKVADLLNRHSIGFPGAQPVSFARHHIDELQRHDYFLCEKTDGIRCLLFLTSYLGPGGEDVEAQHLIDRKNDYYYIPKDMLHIPPKALHAPGYDIAGHHTGTLLDGELVMQRTAHGKRLAYLIFDMLACQGENIMQRPFDKRYARILEFVTEPYRKFANDPRYKKDVQEMAPFDIQLKKMELPYGTEMMFKDKIPRLPHGNDGLIFTCVTTAYVSGTDEHILKWKPPEENTIDFRFQIDHFPTEVDEDGEYEDFDAIPEVHLMVNHGSNYQYFATLSLTEPVWEKMKRLNQPFDGRIIECYRDPGTGQWRPKLEKDGAPRFRDDKTDANHITVVQSVLESIKDAVSQEDLIAAAPAIKVAYKRREAEKKAAMAAAEAEERKRREAAAEAMRAQQQAAQRQAQHPQDEDDGPAYSED
jgi:mRNA guanylyltransferase